MQSFWTNCCGNRL